MARGARRRAAQPVPGSQRPAPAGRARRAPRSDARAGALRERVERGPADAPPDLRRRGPVGARVRADLRLARSHRPRHRDDRRDGGAGGRLQRLTDRGGRCSSRRNGPRSCSCAAPTTRRERSSSGPRSRRSSARSSTTGRACSSSTRPTASSRDWSALELVADDLPLVVVRTYSKVWSLAALRLGFAVTAPGIVEQLEKVVLPYHLSGRDAARRPHRTVLRRGDARRASTRWSASVAGSPPPSTAFPGSSSTPRERTSC